MSVSFKTLLEKKTSSPFFTVVLYLMAFSFFYNLPIINYSIKGNNELRLYDILGPILLLKYIGLFKVMNAEVKNVLFLKRFYQFMIYCSISILLTLFFAFLKNRILVFVQAFLYLYHMWVFFLTAFFLFYHLSSKIKYRRFLHFIIILILLEMIIVLLQNLGIIPFLWGQEYYTGYLGFNSGTLGPNKIVLGMFALISLTFFVGLSFYRSVKISKILLFGTLSLSLIGLLLSGSRTSYVGAIVFLVYFFFRNTGKFLRFGILAFGLLAIILLMSPSVYLKIDDVIHDRVTYVIDNPDDLKDYEDFTGVYSELSTGRDELHKKYFYYLLSSPEVLPFGKGFVNRMGVGNSAHNIYLSLTNELGLLGVFLFLRWLTSYLFLSKRKIPSIKLALNGLVLAMIVTLYFGEHLYIYRPLFAILGYFLMITVLMLIPFKYIK